MLQEEKGQERLLKTIIDAGLCVQCGACVGHCPYFDFFDGRVMVMDACRSDTGRCADVCPQLENEDAFFEPPPKNPMETVRQVFMARAMEPAIRDRAQYGGIVSSILVYALKKGVIQSAVLTSKGEGSAPRGVIAESEKDILACAGSRYSSSASLSAFNQAVRENRSKIAVVGLPCQMKALAKMKSLDKDTIAKHVALSIGLFCTWSLSHRELNQYLMHEGISSGVIKCDIPPPPSNVFKVQTRDGWFELPLDKVRPYIHRGCSRCLDMTAEYADISVGTVEDKDGWNTVITRSHVGEDMMRMAAKDNIIETRELPETNLEHLKQAALNKKKRGISARVNKKN